LHLLQVVDSAEAQRRQAADSAEVVAAEQPRQADAVAVDAAGVVSN
jgi:hypothetical protein